MTDPQEPQESEKEAGGTTPVSQHEVKRKQRIADLAARIEQDRKRPPEMTPDEYQSLESTGEAVRETRSSPRRDAPQRKSEKSPGRGKRRPEPPWTPLGSQVKDVTNLRRNVLNRKAMQGLPQLSPEERLPVLQRALLNQVAYQAEAQQPETSGEVPRPGSAPPTMTEGMTTMQARVQRAQLAGTRQAQDQWDKLWKDVDSEQVAERDKARNDKVRAVPKGSRGASKEGAGGGRREGAGRHGPRRPGTRLVRNHRALLEARRPGPRPGTWKHRPGPAREALNCLVLEAGRESSTIPRRERMPKKPTLLAERAGTYKAPIPDCWLRAKPQSNRLAA